MEKNVKVSAMIMVALYDDVTELFGYPIVVENEKTAIRGFCNMVSDKNSVVGKNPSNFTLYRIGYYDNKTGEIFSKFDKDADIIISGTEALYINEKD